MYLAMNERANKQWAVKEVRKDGVLDFEAVKQGLVAETDILKKLSHKHLPSIVDVIDTADSFIIIMDYVQGNSLDKALRDFGAQPQEDVIEWSKQLCDVLGYLHTREPAIIYRDMKPANVMLKPDGTISLIDFGTAREHKASKVEDTTCLGTRGYAAPEQYGGMGQTDARTDIYCLGATIYHLVTGMNPSQPPYEIRPITEINPALSTGLEKIILKCTQNNPADRYQSCAELMYDLEHYKDFEDEYIKQQKKKLSLFATSAALTLVFAATSVFGYFSAQAAQADNYEFSWYTAETVDDYVEAILIDPTRTEAYIGDHDEGGSGYDGLLDCLVEDGVLENDASESGLLEKLRRGIDKTGKNGYTTTVKPLEELKTADLAKYQKVCFEIGEHILFYSNVNVPSDRYSAASTWFKEVLDSSDESLAMAKHYDDISTALGQINKYGRGKQTEKLSEAYQTLWNTLVILRDEVSNKEDKENDLKIRVWSQIIYLLSNDPKTTFKYISKDDVTAMMNDVYAKTGTVNIPALKEDIEALQSQITSALDKYNSIKEE